MIPAAQRAVVDGVTTLSSASPAGRHVAALTFRVGRFDETLPTAGVTHTVEHLTFAARPRASYDFNAAVSGRYTTFYMESADPADIGDFIAAVCDGLTADHSAVLERERRVLRTEAASRGSAGPLGTCLAERYGATGPGLVNYQEFGLHRLGWPEVEAWRRRWFTAGNAVLWIAGTVPDGLRLGLPPGPPAPQPEPRPLPAPLPGFVIAGRGGVGASLEGSQSIASWITLDILQRRLTQVLRHEYGLTYDVRRVAEELGRDLMHTWIAADALPEQQAMTAHSMLTTFETLAEAGCDAAKIAESARQIRESYEGPAAPVRMLQRLASDILSDRRPRDPAETVRTAEELLPADVRMAARALYDRMIVTTPALIPAVQGRMNQLPAWSAGTVTGRARQSRDSAAVLTAGVDGVMLGLGPGKQVTVRYDSVAALVRWNDGRQALVGTDGFAVHLDPDEWPDGPAVLEEVAARVSPGLVVAVNEPGSPRPGRGATAGAGLAQAAAAPIAPAAGPRQLGANKPRPPWPLLLGRAVWYLVIAFGILAVAGGDVSGGLGFVVVGAIPLFFFEYRYARKRRRLRDGAAADRA